MKMKLVDSVVKSFKVAKVFRENTDKINAIDFSPNGEHLISCSEDDQIVIYDCEKGIQSRTVNSKKIWRGSYTVYPCQQYFYS